MHWWGRLLPLFSRISFSFLTQNILLLIKKLSAITSEKKIGNDFSIFLTHFLLVLLIFCLAFTYVCSAITSPPLPPPLPPPCLTTNPLHLLVHVRPWPLRCKLHKKIYSKHSLYMHSRAQQCITTPQHPLGHDLHHLHQPLLDPRPLPRHLLTSTSHSRTTLGPWPSLWCTQIAFVALACVVHAYATSTPSYPS